MHIVGIWGYAVPVRTCLTTEVVMNTPWPMLGYVHVLHGEIQALRERIDGRRRHPFQRIVQQPQESQGYTSHYATYMPDTS